MGWCTQGGNVVHSCLESGDACKLKILQKKKTGADSTFSTADTMKSRSLVK